jgi:hypothetical protein
MTPKGFLFDEHVPLAYASALSIWEPAIVVRQVGIQSDSPPKRTTDEKLLAYAEHEGLGIVTFDKETFPVHEAAHIAKGHHTHGIFLVPNGNAVPVRVLCDDLILIWSASSAKEWQDVIVFLPFKRKM